MKTKDEKVAIIYEKVGSHSYGIDMDHMDIEVCLIGNILKYLKGNKEILEKKFNKCPRCGSNVSFEEGQQSFPETGQWDFPDSWGCEDDHKKGCDWDTTYGKEAFELIMIENTVDEIVGNYSGDAIWGDFLDPIEEQTEDCIDYIFNSIK